MALIANQNADIARRVTNIENGIAAGFKGSWNAATNTPALVAGVGNGGDWYEVNVAGTSSITGVSTTFAVGDELRFTVNGNKWVRTPYGGGGVASVNSKVGAVTLVPSDIGAAPSVAPTISGSAIFTGTPRLESTNPRLDFVDTDATSGSRFVSLNAQSGTMSIQRRADDGSFVSNVQVLDVTGGKYTTFPALAVTVLPSVDNTYGMGSASFRLANIHSVLATIGALAIPTALPSFTVSTLPSAALYPRGVIYVSDGTSNKRLAISDGTNWRFPDGAIVS